MLYYKIRKKITCTILRKGNHMANNKKIKNLIVCSAVGGVVLVLAVASIVTGAMRKEKEKQDSVANVSVDRVKLRDDNEQTQVSMAKTEVEIQFEDCAIQTGTQLKLTALVVPENTEQALVWNSSDLSVLDISPEGILTVKGVGTAVVTATVGMVSDSVVVEGIENAADGSKNQFPVYTGGILAIGEGTGTDSTSNSGSNTGVPGNSAAAGNAGTESGAETGNGNAGSSGASGNESAGNGGLSGNENAGSSSSSGNGDTGNGTTPSNSGNASNSGSGNSQNSSSGGNSGDTQQGGSSSGNTGQDIAGELPQIGFTQRYSNVYVCEEGNTYYGEIITQPNVTIIYIKLRSESFDSKIQSVLMQLLPEEYGQVWNNYVSAGTDRTFTAEGRKVRIVAAPNGGHSQIVIYN